MGFGTNGFTTTATNGWPNDATGGAYSIALDSSGRIIAVGPARNNLGNFVVSVARYNVDGALDTNFGTNGLTTQIVPNAATNGAQVVPRKVLVDSNGDIFVFGQASLPPATSSSGGECGFAIKLNSAGSLYTSFGASGSSLVTPGNIATGIYDAIPLQDGSFLYAGYQLAGSTYVPLLGKLNSDGSASSSFGVSGAISFASWGYGSATSIAIETGGGILVGVSGQGSVSVTRFTPNGVLDSSYGANGTYSMQYLGQHTSLDEVLLQADGKAVIVGSFHTGAGVQLLVTRLDQSGRVDTTFGSNGVTTLTVSANGTLATDTAILADGSILLSGHADVFPNRDVLLAKLDPSGRLDSSFGNAGVKRTDLGANQDTFASLVVRPDGSIVAAGETVDTAANSTRFLIAQFTSNGAIDDGTAPTIGVIANQSNITSGGAATITFALSESSTDFVASDITVSGGSISNFSGSGTTYTATFTPTANSTTNGVISVASGTFSDAAGNFNADGSDANNTATIAVNTLSVANPICFARGTRISGQEGLVLVESLRPHATVIDNEGKATNVKWIGYQRRTPEFAQFDDYLPVKICAGALAENVPVRDLYLSPDHAILVDGHLIHAKALVNGKSIVQMTEWQGDIEYYHIETENHEIIFAEGVPCETFIDNVSREQFDNYAEYQALYPFSTVMKELPLPRVRHRRQLPSAIAARIDQRAQVLARQASS